MASTVHALLVGIDAYRSPVPPLRGCGNDIEAVGALLTSRCRSTGDELSVLVLRDGEATREAVIAGFRNHLARARSGETALFYYSGHGSQEDALPEHYHLEPDHLNETLVLVDSRDQGGHDLADKELAQLVAEVSAGGAHVLLVLDCCHSGSGVRAGLEDGVALRRAPTDHRPRPRETYLFAGSDVAGHDAAQRAGDVLPITRETRADWLNLSSSSRYVLLAACRSDQTAKEVRVAGTPRGALSVALERALSTLAPDTSYAQLLPWLTAGVRGLASEQTPVLETAVDDDAGQAFLGGAAAVPEPFFTAAYRQGRGWVLDAGLLHGIPSPAGGGATSLTLHRFGGTTLEESEALTRALVAQSSASSADLALDDPDAVDRGETYRAVVRTLPTPLAAVAVEGDGDVAAHVRSVLAGSPVLRVVPPGVPCSLHVSCHAGRMRLTKPGADRPLVAVEKSSDDAALARLVAATTTVARWTSVLERRNPTSTLVGTSVELACFDANHERLGTSDGAVELAYAVGAGAPRQPVLRLRVSNRSTVRLYCAVLALTDLYGIGLLGGGAFWLDPGQESWLLGDDGQPALYTFVPDGQDRATDVLKLLASTEEFDAWALRQEELSPPTLSRGALASDTRGVGGSRLHVPASGTWTTREVVVTTTRPPQARAVTADRPTGLGDGVTVDAHPALRATARLVSRTDVSRAAVAPLVPPALAESPGLSEPFALGASRSVGEELSLLELTGVVDAGVVTEAQPLVLHVDRPLTTGHLVLPIAFDGEDYLPLGSASATTDGGTRITLSRLPGVGEPTRGLGRSVSILFQKLVLAPLGAGYDYPRLSLVSFDHEQSRRSWDEGDVRAGLSAARRVLLLVHGLLGDTRPMAAALARSGALSHYDAVLAFDYECVGTSIEDTADALAQKLAAVGLTGPSGQGDRTTVDVLAHSVGGLVARWFVERAGGSQVVDRVVLCGAPNTGSPWPRVQDLATSAVALALNGIGELTGPWGVAAKVLGFAVQGMEKVDVTLDQIHPRSALLSELRTSPPPELPYVAVAGDQPFGTLSDQSVARRVLTKLRVPGAVLTRLFSGEPHDVVVSVRSATTFGDAWSPVPAARAGCNHLTYFASDAGISAVRSALSAR